MKFELTGFQTTIRENIVLALGQTLSLNMQMPIATLQETVTVTAETPIVDVTTTRIGSDFSGEKLVGIPSATDLWATLAQAPGVRMLGFDTGGSQKSQQTGYESFGVRNQNRVVTDGVDTTEGTGGAGFYQDFFAHEEITVSAAGADVSMNTPGSAVVSPSRAAATISSRSPMSPTSRIASSATTSTTKPRSGGFTGQPNILFWEAHTDVGGPIKRDKVWFYGAYNHFKIDKEISGVPRQSSDLGVFDNYTGK